MRIAVTGAGGGVGRAFLDTVPAHHEVLAFAHTELPVEDRHAVLQTLVPAEPDAIFHLAAMTSVDGCEEDPDRAYLVNALGSGNVALAARRAGALLVLASTDYVFDGDKGSPYHEFDRTNPLSVYGKSKLAAEEEVRALVEEHVIVRTSWVFGAGDDFVSRSIPHLAAGEAVGGIVDRTGTPTYVRHLAERLLPAALSGHRGVIHLAGTEPATWHEVLVRSKAMGGLRGEVTEQKAGDLGLPAPRPVYSPLTSLVLERTSVPPMPPLDEGIRAVVEEWRGRG